MENQYFTSPLIAAELQLEYVGLFELAPAGDSVQLVGGNGADQAAIGSVEHLEPDSVFADATLRAGQPVVVDVPMDKGHYVIFAHNPIYRGETVALSLWQR